MSRMKLVGLMICILLSGCIDSPSSSVDEEPVDTTASISDLIPNLVLGKCLTGITSMDDPQSRTETELPSGWRYFSYSRTMARLTWLVCEDVAFEDLERHNVTFLIESNYGPMIPENCADSLDVAIGRTVNLVRGIWTSDEDIADRLETKLETKVSIFDLSFEGNQGSVGSTASIKWNIEGKLSGNLELQSNHDATSTFTEPTELYVWPIDSGVGFWVATVDELSQDEGSLLANGQVNPPHRNPAGLESWTGGAAMTTTDTSLEFYSFEDSLCETPSS